LPYLVFLVFHSFPLINYGGDSSVLNKNKENYFVRHPRRDPGCDKSIFRRIATLLQRVISCGDTDEDTVAAYELARTHSREGQVYTRRARGVRGRGRGSSSS